MSFGAEVDEGSFEAGFYPGDPGFEDAGLFLLPTGVFQVEVVELLAIDQRNPDLFGLGGVDEHSFHLLIPFGPPCRREGETLSLSRGSRRSKGKRKYLRGYRPGDTR